MWPLLCNTSAAWRRLCEHYRNGTTRRTCEQCQIQNIKVFVLCFGVISSCHATRIWRRMTETPALLISVIFLSCIFQPCTFVRYFPVLHFPALYFYPLYSSPAFSPPPPDILLSVIFLSCIFSAPLGPSYDTWNSLWSIFQINNQTHVIHYATVRGIEKCDMHCHNGWLMTPCTAYIYTLIYALSVPAVTQLQLNESSHVSWQRHAAPPSGM